jgi:membrane protease YdiL (CAAX protease family)
MDVYPPSPRWPVGSWRSVGFSFALVYAHFVVLFGVGYGLLHLLGVDPREILDAPPLVFVVLAVVASADVGLVFTLLLRRVGRYRLRELGWSRFAASDVAAGIAGAVALVGVAFLVMIARKGSFDRALEYLLGAFTDFALNERALCVFIGCVAAFTEETMFRGLMQPALQHRLGRTGGLVVTALVFAAYHGRFTPTIFLGKLGVGLVLGALRERTGTLWAPAIAHMLQWSLLCFA